ncbi:4-(cytidine 5'-diphospho)-2-C-methyl-D-erythritol kinase [Alteromonas gilva]|uniref:4-diphosphocytidyl-2-C-methyl-D-erythritol kinase n=1 Tax=Alteromonas gilva TaxID=2987522 RepID=A0ABT5L260_9ALTE|nr:4-(cytidine 5'-diphospho)-2-C-methyl-D-erythritol kinase [Alteromonas gilva]MDC8830561.1 4-(cytidine 5'-diphospho)-2-C-methyl-D-erythritol kinase [Alteromonas gilva]
MDTLIQTHGAPDWWPSPAKLNLFLHITGRNEDGYHQLQTLFQMLDYGDQLAFTPTDTGEIVLLNAMPGVKNEDNLIYRAAQLLKAYCNVPYGCDILIDKQLPMGGGIGGGSSNAATTLVALNHYWQCGLTVQELATIALKLGADVPIFVHGKTAFAAGVGEKITPVTLDKRTYLVVFPGIHISTAEVFGKPDLPRNSPPIDWQDYTFESTRNDCEKIVCKSAPEVANLLRWLLHYAPSRMTGTGACVFASFCDPEQAKAALHALPEKWTGFVANGMHTSPLILKLEQVSKAQTT